MEPIVIWIAISIVVLFTLVLPSIVAGRKENILTPLAALAFGCVLAGIIFGSERMIGYGFLGAAAAIGIVDMLKKLRSA